MLTTSLIPALICGVLNCPNAQACDTAMTATAATPTAQIIDAAYNASAGASADVYSFDGHYAHRDWRIVVDGVMGGLSTGKRIVNDEGIMVFSGELSTKNNGGFSALRSPADKYDFDGADGFRVRVKGDGRTYRFDALINSRPVDREYNSRTERWRVWQEFATVDGEWIEVDLPFERFSEPTMFGTAVPDGKPLDTSMIKRIGFMVADYIDAPFRLEIDWVRTYSGSAKTNSRLNNVIAKLNFDKPAATTTEASASSGRTAERLARVAAKAEANVLAADRTPVQAQTPSMSVEDYIVAAIDRGVPLFNDGQPGACAAVYEIAVAGLVGFGGDNLSDEQHSRLVSSLTHLPEQASERAWSLRRALDDVLRMEATRQMASRH